MSSTATELQSQLLRVLDAHGIALNLPTPSPALKHEDTSLSTLQTPDHSTPASAMPQALASPEILLTVLDHVLEWDDCDERREVLRSASLVSRLWRALAQPVLWRCPPALDSFEIQALFLRGATCATAPLGECVRSLDICWYPLGAHGHLIAQIAEHCPNVNTLRLRRGAVADMEGVTVVDLDFVLRILAAFPALKHLNVNHIDDAAGVATALALPDLRTTTKQTPLPQLQSLCMTGVPQLEFDVGMFRALRALQISSWTRMPPSRVTTLAQACPELRSLRLQWNIVNADVCAFIEHCRMLETVDVIQLRESGSPSPPATLLDSDSWIELAAKNLPYLRCIRTNGAAYAADIQALAVAEAPLTTLALNRVEVCDEQDIVSLVRRHHATMKQLTLINWDAISVRGLPVGDTTLAALATCPNLQTLEVDFEPPKQGELPHAPLRFVGERQVQDETIVSLLDRCPMLVRTPELLALGKMHATDSDMGLRRIEMLADWEPELDEEVAYEVMGW